MPQIIDYPIPITRGGTGAGIRADAFNALAPQSPSTDDTIIWDGSNWIVNPALLSESMDLIIQCRVYGN